MKFCMNCGTQLPDAAKFCLSCGCAQDIAVTTTPTPTPAVIHQEHIVVDEGRTTRPQKPKKAFPWMQVLCNSLILLVAILFFVFSFCPVIKYDTESLLGEDFDFELSFSTLDTFVLVFDSFKSMDLTEIQESKLYEELLDIANDMSSWKAEELDDLTRGERRDLRRFVSLSLRITLQQETVPTPVFLVISAVVGLLYLLANTAFLVLAILNFISSFGKLAHARKALYNWANALFVASPTIMLILYYSLYIFLGDAKSGIEMCGAPIATLIISLALLAFLIVLRFVFVKPARASIRLFPTILTAVAAVLVICFLFAPIYSTTVRAPFKSSVSTSSTTREATIHLGVGFFSSFELDDTAMEKLDDVRDMTREEKKSYFETLLNRFNSLTRSEAEEDAGVLLNTNLLTELTVVKSSYEVPAVLALIPLLFVLTLIGALVALWSVCLYVITGKNFKVLSLIGKIVCVFFAVASLVVVAVYLIMIIGLIDTYLPSRYQLSMGAGSILFTITAAGLVCVPSNLIRKKKKVVVAPQEVPEAEVVTDAAE